MNEDKLRATASALVGGRKGLLAMDESTGTCNKRFAKVGIPHTVRVIARCGARATAPICSRPLAIRICW